MITFNSLIAELKKDPSNFPMHLIEHSNEVLQMIKDIEGVKSNVQLDNVNHDLDRIRFSAILSDFTNIFPKDLDGGGRIIINAKANHSFTVSNRLLSSIVHEDSQPIIQSGYIIPSPEKTKNFIKEIEPLIEIRKVLYSNPRILIGLSNKEKTNDGGRTWNVHDVDQNSPEGNWLAMEESEESNALPINFSGFESNNKQELFEITIPYLKGISFKDLALILNDHEDLLSQFRVNLTTIINQAKIDGKSINEMKNDLIRPEVDKISKQFSTIKNIHKLKVSGITVSTATLGLISFSTAGMGALVSGFLGSSGLGLLLKQEADYQKEISELQNNPLYLMWKFKKERNVS